MEIGIVTSDDFEELENNTTNLALIIYEKLLGSSKEFAFFVGDAFSEKLAKDVAYMLEEEGCYATVSQVNKSQYLHSDQVDKHITVGVSYCSYSPDYPAEAGYTLTLKEHWLSE